MKCQKKMGAHDTIQFYFDSIAEDQLDLTSITFEFKNFHTPWSARDMDKIDIRTFPNKECTGTNFQGYQVSALTILPGEIDAENCSVTSTSNILGHTKADNALVFSFTPQTTLSKSGSGMLRLGIPKWYEVGSKINFMYNVEASNACTSAQMKITSSVPSVLDRFIQIRYEDMEERFFSGQRITIRCTQFYNPIYQDMWGGFTVATFDDEVLVAAIERSEAVALDATDYLPATIAQAQFNI